MKILLLSDIPPCNTFTAGLVLSEIVRLLPRDSVCGFIVANPTLDISVPEDFGNIPFELRLKPNENWAWLPQGRVLRKVSALASWVGETVIEKTTVAGLINDAVAFAREQRVDRVWAVLQGQTTIRMAKAVADQLGVPLHSQVWDPFSWWAYANCMNGWSQRRIQRLFNDTISASETVATASESMADHYQREFGTVALPLISSHSRAMAQNPETGGGVGNSLLIGMAGQFYAANEWCELVRALCEANWTVAGRSVRLVVMGPQQPPGQADGRITFMGWKEQHEAAIILSQCDLLYCPYPFATTMEEVSRYSFPSKLVLYLSAGRPIVFHGPEDSAPARYLEKRRCGIIVGKPFATAIFNGLEQLTIDAHYYAELAHHAKEAFLDDFTLEAMVRSVDSFLGREICQLGKEAEMRSRHRTKGVGLRTMPEAERRRSFVATLLLAGRALRWLKRRVQRVPVWLALRVPKLKSIHHEIHRLHAEISALQEYNVRLSAENERLATILAARDMERAADSAAGQIVSEIPQAVAALYSQNRVLVLTRSGFPSGVVEGFLRADALWSEVRGSLVSAAVRRLLRHVLEGAIERLVVDAQWIDLVALALEVANLASIRATVLADPGDIDIAWLSGQPQADLLIKPCRDKQDSTPPTRLAV